MILKNRKIYYYIRDNKFNIEEIMKDYTNYIYTIITNYSCNFSKEDIEEIALDVFFTLWKNQGKLNINNSMSSYIAGITRNLIKLKYRYIKENDNIDDYEEKIIDLSSIELNFSNSERYKNIMRTLNSFKEEDKQIFISYYNDEKSIREISLIFNISESKIKSKLHRTRKKIKKVLNEMEGNSNE